MRTEPPAGDEFTRMLVTMKRNVLEEASRDPAPARRRARNRAIITSTAILLTLGLGAGAAIAAGMIGEDEEPGMEAQPSATVAATPAPAPTPTPFGIETAPPVDPLVTVATVRVHADRLDLLGSDGAVVSTITYDDTGDSAAGILSAVFGAPAEMEERLDADGNLAARQYRWDGFLMVEHLAPGMHRADTRLWVRFEQPTIGDGVSVTTITGFAPGDDLESYAYGSGQPYDPTIGAENLIQIEMTGPIDGDPNHVHSVVASDHTEHEATASVVFAPFDFLAEDGTN